MFVSQVAYVYQAILDIRVTGCTKKRRRKKLPGLSKGNFIGR